MLDSKGVIRATDVWGEKLDRILESLMEEVWRPTP